MMNPADLGGCEGREFDPPVETLDIESLLAKFPLSTCVIDVEGPHLKEATVTNSKEVNSRIGREMIRVIYKLQTLPLPLPIMESEPEAGTFCKRRRHCKLNVNWCKAGW